MADLALNILLQVKDLASQGIASAGKSIGQLAMPATIAAAAVVGIGIAAVKAASDFQSGLTSLVTGAGETQANLQMVGDGIKQISVNTGTSTQELISGMYMIESSGLHGAAGLQVLQAAAEGAKVGNASLADVANGVTTALTDYKLPASQAAQVTNDLIATVASGKTHMQDLAQSLSTILPTAAAAGVGLTDTTAALATMTGEGTNAASASTYLRQTILALEAPAKAATTTLKEVGLSTTEVSTEMKKSLPDALQMITEAVGKKFPVGSAGYIAALKNIVGGTKQLQGILELTGTHMQTFQGNVKGITDSVTKGGNSITGWSNVQKDFNQQMAQASAAVNVLLINIGQQLLPIISRVVGAIAPVISNFANWVTTIGNTNDMVGIFGGVLVGLSVIILASVVPALAAMAIETIAATWPILAIGIAVGALAYLIITHFKQIQEAFPGVFAAFKSLGDFVSGTMDAISRKTQEDTLNAKISAINNTIAQKQALIDNYNQQRAAIESQMEKTHSAVQRAALQQKLDVINASNQQADGAIKAAKKQRAGVESELAKTDPVVALHTLKQKETSISNSLVQAQKTVSNLAMQRAGIEHEMAACHNAVQKHSLAMKLAATDAAMKQKEGVVKHFEQQKAGVEKSMGQQKAIIAKDAGGNVFISMWRNVQSVFGNIMSGIGAAMKALQPIFDAIGGAVKAVGGVISSNFAPVGKQLQQTWASLQPTFKQLGDALTQLKPVFLLIAGIIGGAVVGALGVLMGIITGLAKGLSAFIGGLISVFKGAIQAFTGAIQIIAGIVRAIIDIFTGNFKDLGPALHQILGGVVNIFKGIWSAIQGIFQMTVGTIWGIVSGFVEGIIRFFTSLWDRLVGHSIVPDMINGIIKWFTSLPGKIFGMLGGFVSGVISKAGDMAKGFLQAVGLIPKGTNQQMQLTKDKAMLHTLQMKDGVVMHTAEMNQKAVQRLSIMRNGIIEQIKNTSDPVKKHALEMQLAHTDQMIQMHENAVNEAAKMHDEIVDKAQKIKDDMKKHSTDTQTSTASIWTNIQSSVGTAVGTMWKNVTSAFQNAWSGLSGALSSLWTNISTWFSNLASNAVTWGSNFITMLASGITGAASKITSAVSGIAGNIKKFLGFGSPTEAGPGAKSDQWAPNFMKMFTAGLMANVANLKVAATAAATAMQEGLTGQSMQLHMILNAGQQEVNAAAQAKAMTELTKEIAKWNSEKHKAGSVDPYLKKLVELQQKKVALPMGIYSNALTQMANPSAGIGQNTTTTASSSSTNNAQKIELHFHTNASDPRQVAKYTMSEMTKVLNGSGTATTMTSGGKVS